MITVSFLKFPRKSRWFAMKQMGIAHEWLKRIDGCNFYKLMGSGGGNGFSIIPDLSTYCLLAKWDSIEQREQFFSEHQEWLNYLEHSSKNFTVYLQATKAMGLWGGQQPFEIKENGIGNTKIAVLTRATIKKKFIPYFWSHVPKASAQVNQTEGHIFSKGVGEVPLLHQATISIWENKESMYKYAYQHESHVNMIRKTREKGWYKEELFAEFAVQEVRGEIWK